MKKWKVLCFEPSVDKYFEEAGCQVVRCGRKKAEILREAVDCDEILTRTEVIDADIMRAAPNLKIVSRFGMGFDNIDIDAAAGLGIWATNVPAGNIEAVAEGVIYHILASGRCFNRLERGMRRGDWELRNQLHGWEVKGKTLALIGVGKIGSIVAQKAYAGLGMTVIAYDPYVPQAKAPAGVTMIESREEVFRRGDFVSIHMPYFGKVLVGEEELSWMKPSAYLINAARGRVLDEAALIRALRSGKIAGAGLDVFEQEPPLADDPLLTMENVVLTPHCTGITEEVFQRNAIQSSRSVLDALAGKEPECSVNHPDRPRNMKMKE